MSSEPSPSLISVLVHHYDELVDHLRRRFGDRGFARDVMQDVCLQILEQPPKQDVQTPVVFLRRISTHLAIDRYRVEQGRHALLESMREVTEQTTGISGQEELIAAEQELDVIIEVINNLPPRCREVFLMHKIHLLPQAEVAKRLGISRQMVEKHLKTAMASCRARLQSLSLS